MKFLGNSMVKFLIYENYKRVLKLLMNGILIRVMIWFRWWGFFRWGLMVR